MVSRLNAVKKLTVPVGFVGTLLVFSASKAPVTGYRRSWACSASGEHLARRCKVSLVELPAPKNK